MSKKSQLNKNSEPEPSQIPPNDDDKIRIAIPLRWVRSFTSIGTNIFVVSISLSFSPYLQTFQPKQLSPCLPSQTIQVSPKNLP
ncbi:MAG: hypothetical protein ACOYMQ_13355 [Pseudanabaena sp.]|jgi:hypothetical protein